MARKQTLEALLRYCLHLFSPCSEETPLYQTTMTKAFAVHWRTVARHLLLSRVAVLTPLRSVVDSFVVVRLPSTKSENGVAALSPASLQCSMQ